MASSEPVSVYYLASGRLGVPLLDALAGDARIRLVGVGTQPDRLGGRHRRPIATPIGAHAERLGRTADRVPSVNADAFLSRLSAIAPEVVVVASFGQILKPALLALPACGCFNVHASLLPRHRGAAPVSAAILAGDARTGISFMRMDAGLDTGPVYRTLSTPIGPAETTGELEERLAHLAAGGLVDCLWDVARGGLAAVPQPREGVTYAARLVKEDGRLDWSLSALQLSRQVRAMAPWPGTFTEMLTGGRRLRLQVLSVAVQAGVLHRGQPGEVLQADGDGWVIACGEGALRLTQVRAEGRAAMDADAFLRGHRVPVGTRLGVPEHEEGQNSFSS